MIDYLFRFRGGKPYTRKSGASLKFCGLARETHVGQSNRCYLRHRSPRWALAWKFPVKKEIAILEDIVVQVGRAGILTPAALLQPADVGGITVTRATLHNQDEVKKKDVRPSDEVRIERAGDVIPEVVERIKKPGIKRAKPFPIFFMPWAFATWVSGWLASWLWNIST